MLTVYTYASCDTCRKAVKWLRSRHIDFVEKPIRETPPTVGELAAVLAAYAADRRKILNTSGRDYREQKLGEILPTLSDKELLKRLSANGNLVKRPFVIGDKAALAGFDEASWSRALT